MAPFSESIIGRFRVLPAPSFSSSAHLSNSTHLARISVTHSSKPHFAYCSSCNSKPLNFCGKWGYGDVGAPQMAFGKMGFDLGGIKAVSDAGSGGNGGFRGTSGGGNFDGGWEDENDGAKQSWLSWYSIALERHPVFTKAWTSALLNFLGDAICQFVVSRMPSLDLKRSLMFTFLGFALVGPTLHFWYSYLSKLVVMPGASGAFLRLLLDQFLFSPLFIGVFLSCLVTLEGKPKEIMPKLQQAWLPAVVANWQLWIPFQFLNFRFVPQHFQVLTANVIALAWNVILSFKAHKEILPKG